MMMVGGGYQLGVVCVVRLNSSLVVRVVGCSTTMVLKLIEMMVGGGYQLGVVCVVCLNSSLVVRVVGCSTTMVLKLIFECIELLSLRLYISSVF